MTDRLTYGYARKRDVPADGGRPKVCPKCSLWFSAKSRERICAGCRPRYQQARMATRKGPVKSANPQQDGTFSSVLGITFKRTLPPYRILALEAAAAERWTWSPRAAAGAIRACEPDCICEPCVASRPTEYAGV